MSSATSPPVMVLPAFPKASLPPGVVGINVRIENVVNRLVGELANGREGLIAHLRQAGVDQQHAVLTDLQRDIAAVAREHVDILLDRQDFEPG